MRPRLSRLRALSPVAILFGPIFQKEMRIAGRKRGTYIIRFLDAAGLLAVAAIAFTGLVQSLRWQSPIQRMQSLQEFAPLIVHAIVWFQYAALGLTAPLLTCGAICEERRARTLPALLTTPLSAAQIVFGKLSSRLVQLLILALLATPLLLAVRVFGGIDAEVIVAGMAVSISTVVLGAALGLAYSVRHRRAATAALLALFSVALLQGAPLAATAIVFINWIEPANPNAQFPFWMMGTCSPAVLAATSIGALAGPVAPVATRALWVANTAYNLALAFPILLTATIAVRRAMLADATTDGAGATKRHARRVAAPAAPGDSAPAPAASEDVPGRRERTVSDHPVLWREVRQAAFGSRRVTWIGLGIAAAGLSMLYAAFGLDEEALHGSLVVIGVLAAMASAVFLTAGGISGEREARSWDVLLTTPLTAREILLGKYIGALRRQWFIPTVVLGHLLFSTAVGEVQPLFILHVSLIMLGPLLLLTATGLLFSLLVRQSTAAAVCNLATALALWIGSWIALGLLSWFFEGLADLDGADLLLQANFVISPVPMMISATEGALGSRSHEFVTGRIGRWEFTMLVVAAFLAYALAAAAVLAVAHGLFRTRSGRAYPPPGGAALLARDMARLGAFVLLAMVGGGIGYSLAGWPGFALGVAAVLGVLFALAQWEKRRSRATPGPA